MSEQEVSNTALCDESERLRRWRLALGAEADGGGGGGLNPEDAAMDRALQMLYEGGGASQQSGKRSHGSGASMPHVARWLGDIRSYFPSGVVQVMQKDAMERLNLKQMLLEPEMLEAVTPDVHLVSTLISLKGVLPAKARETARLVVRKVTDELQRRLASPLRQAVTGSLNRSVRNNRPRHNEIDWHRTIRLNLKHYQPEYRTVIPERRVGYGRKRTALREVVLNLDQSGSMGNSVVYAGVLGSVLASLPSIRTRIVAYDTSVVDLTDQADDPVDILFGVQLGGGTDTPQALKYCRSLIRQPSETIFIHISDLEDGHQAKEVHQLMSEMVLAGIQVIVLLALDDSGAPGYDAENAAGLASLGLPVFACTPDLFPELMAAAIERRNIQQWAAQRDIVTARAAEA